ncbi:ORF16 [Sulfolobus spindle-shaped virus 3]|nr:ORF16 [Sulfolobus spindle-shaped virus 3]
MVEPRKILPDGTKLYSWDDLDKAIEEAEDVDLTVSDLILFLLWCDKDKPIFGNTKLVKEAYVFWLELTSKGYKVEDPHFYPYNYGPYSKFIMATVEDLYFAGFIIIASGMKRGQYAYMLSKKGLMEAEELVKEKIRPEDIEYFKRRRRGLDRLSPRIRR